jgi:hypothetical protein
MKQEKHLINRPHKNVYSKKSIERLRSKAIKKIKLKFLPDNKIIKIIIIGSAVKNSFGKYERPGFRRSLYSDFDFVIFVEDGYKIPKLLKKEPTAKPFSESKLNLAYRNKKFIDNKYDLEVFFIREKNMHNKNIQKEGELAGIPMTKNSKNKYIIVYESKIKKH